MRKSDQKKLDRAKKNSDRQKRHRTRLYSAQAKREAKQEHYMDLLAKKTQRLYDRDVKDERIKEQLNHNLEILATLEKQYDAEQAAKQEVNADLEGKGLTSLEDKMKYLSDLAAEKQKKEAEEGRSMTGSAEVGFTPADL